MTDPKDPTQPISPWSAPTPATPGATPTVPPTPATPGATPAVPPTLTLGSATSPTPQHDVPVAPVSTIRPAPRRRRGLVDVVLVVAAIFAIGGVGFAVGRVTATTTAAATTGRGQGQFQGNGQFPGGANGGGPNGSPIPGGGQGGFGLGGGITISGEVVDVTADHLTLKLANGQSVEIGLSGTTAYHSETSATVADVTPGNTVHVQVSRAGGGTGGTGATGGTGGAANGRAFGSATDITVVPK